MNRDQQHPQPTRKRLSQALDEAVSCSEKRHLWLELQPRGPGSMGSVPRRGSSAAAAAATTTTTRVCCFWHRQSADLHIHTSTHRHRPPSPHPCFVLNSHRTAFARRKHLLLMRFLIKRESDALVGGGD